MSSTPQLPTTLTPFPPLPAELYRAIIQQVTDLHTLTSLCLVSRFFRSCATPVLYRNINICIVQDDDWPENYPDHDYNPYEESHGMTGPEIKRQSRQQYHLIEALRGKNAQYVETLGVSEPCPYTCCMWYPEDGEMVLEVKWMTDGLESGEQRLELSKMPRLRKLKFVFPQLGVLPFRFIADLASTPDLRSALRNNNITHLEYEIPRFSDRYPPITLPEGLTHFTATGFKELKPFFSTVSEALSNTPSLQCLHFDASSYIYLPSGEGYDTPTLPMLFRNHPELPELRSIICNNFPLGDFPFQIQGTAHSRESYPRCLRSLDSLVLDGDKQGLLEHYCFLGMQWRELQLMDVGLESATNLMQGSRLETLRVKSTWREVSSYEADTDDDSENGGHGESCRVLDTDVHVPEFAAELGRHVGTLQELRLCGRNVWDMDLEIVRAVAVCAGLKHLVLTGDGWGPAGSPSPRLIQTQVLPLLSEGLHSLETLCLEVKLNHAERDELLNCCMGLFWDAAKTRGTECKLRWISFTSGSEYWKIMPSETEPGWVLEERYPERYTEDGTEVTFNSDGVPTKSVWERTWSWRVCTDLNRED